MIKAVSEIIVDGFGSGEVDFAQRPANSSTAVQQQFDTQITQPILDVLATSDESGVLQILGHADRDDTLGLTLEKARSTEVARSLQRAMHAEEEVNTIISQALGQNDRDASYGSLPN